MYQVSGALARLEALASSRPIGERLEAPPTTGLKMSWYRGRCRSWNQKNIIYIIANVILSLL